MSTTITILLISDNSKWEYLGLHVLALELRKYPINTIIVPWNIEPHILHTILHSVRPTVPSLTHLRTPNVNHYLQIYKTFPTKIIVHESEGYPYERDYDNCLAEINLYEISQIFRMYTWGPKETSILVDKFPLLAQNFCKPIRQDYLHWP